MVVIVKKNAERDFKNKLLQLEENKKSALLNSQNSMNNGGLSGRQIRTTTFFCKQYWQVHHLVPT